MHSVYKLRIKELITFGLGDLGYKKRGIYVSWMFGKMF